MDAKGRIQQRAIVDVPPEPPKPVEPPLLPKSPPPVVFVPPKPVLVVLPKPVARRIE
jgi:hypothetical protein